MVPEPVDKAWAQTSNSMNRERPKYTPEPKPEPPPLPDRCRHFDRPDDKTVLLVFCKNNRREFSLAEKCLNLTSGRAQ
jgi:hypothetical protein